MKKAKIVIFLALQISIQCFATYPFNTIDTPGFYKLAGNFTGGIAINTSDTTLDMNGHTINGGLPNGIVVNESLRNVTIKNGVIQDAFAAGIEVKSGCSGIVLKDISVSYSSRGISFDQVNNSTIRNCDIALSSTGIELNSCHGILIDNCISRSSSQAGYSLLSSTTCSVLNCKAMNNGSENTNESGPESFVYGFVSSGGNGNMFKDCIALATQNFTSTAYATEVVGFGLRNNEQCTSILSCESNNTASGASGFTIPTGILLEGTFDSTTSLTNRVIGLSIHAVDWSPDGRYIAVENFSSPNSTIVIFKYDYENDELIFITESTPIFGGIRVIRWSHDGQYLATGNYGANRLALLSFNPIDESITLLLQPAIGSPSNISYSVAWSADDKFILLSGSYSTSPVTDALLIFAFDKAINELTYITSGFRPETSVFSVLASDWHPKKNRLLASQGMVSPDVLRLYELDAANETLVLIESKSVLPSERAGSMRWSPDGNYLMIGGNGVGIFIYKYDHTAASNKLSLAGTLSIGGGAQNVQWSPDSKYILVGPMFGGSPGLSVYRVNRDSSSTVSFSLVSNLNTTSRTWGGSFSPDGSRIAAIQSSVLPLEIFSGIVFPSNNLIKDNRVFCSIGSSLSQGFGISGSSILNAIIGNIAYGSSCNYVFVANKFNQLFNQGPSVLQNYGLEHKDIVTQPDDIPARIKRTELLLESLIDNLL